MNALKHHRIAKKAASLSVRALLKMGHVVKKLHEKGYDERAAKLLLATSERLMQEASRLEREAKRSKGSKPKKKGKVKKRSKKKRR
ncbi:MAG: hypothetical protein AABX70_02295 [Nanoarchaeota archaeon]